MKKDIMELKQVIKLNQDGLLRLAHCQTAAAGPFKIAKEMYSADKEYTTIGLSKHWYEDGTAATVFLVFDDAGILRETAIELWEAV